MAAHDSLTLKVKVEVWFSAKFILFNRSWQHSKECYRYL